ncbi:DUF488 domain-containing protein [Nocardia jejuensis]|uniref:DUF488 domain-containing protein n=1 Tax=Nocardia jejuensis TaxID=328049 RepID=UPI000A6CA37E|nr:DUF488 domain-containing protein [Nocardia jejuensis]
MTTARPTSVMNPLFSIGYEGRDVDELIAMLLRARVATVADVRLTPISRKPGLSKTKLALALDEAGIRYVHLRELGNPRDNRAPFREGTPDGRNRFAEILNRTEALEAMRAVRELIDDGPVALLCFERDHSTCHRHMIAESIHTGAAGLDVIHL